MLLLFDRERVKDNQGWREKERERGSERGREGERERPGRETEKEVPGVVSEGAGVWRGGLSFTVRACVCAGACVRACVQIHTSKSWRRCCSR